jgi:hypothetical protein
MVSAGGIVAIIGLIAVGALVFSVRDDIRNRINPPSPEELDVQKKEKDRGALANTQAFVFGEESLRPSKAPPNLASLQRDTKVIQRQLGIPNTANFTVTNKGVIISEKPPTFALSTEEQLTASQALARNRRKTQKENKAFDVMTQATIPSTNDNNVVGRPTRISKGEKKRPVKKRQGRFRTRGLIPAETGVNKNNVVPISTRRTSNERKGQGITESNIEVKEVNLQVG